MENKKENLENVQVIETENEKKKVLDDLFEVEVVDTAFTCHEPRHIN